jgi:hypothetical protein
MSRVLVRRLSVLAGEMKKDFGARTARAPAGTAAPAPRFPPQGRRPGQNSKTRPQCDEVPLRERAWRMATSVTCEQEASEVFAFCLSLARRATHGPHGAKKRRAGVERSLLCLPISGTSFSLFLGWCAPRSCERRGEFRGARGLSLLHASS